MTDPRDPHRDPRLDPAYRDYEPGPDMRAHMQADARNTTWGWIAGIVAAIFIVAIVYGFSNRTTMTATETSPPAATTGAAPATPSPPPPAAPNAR